MNFSDIFKSSFLENVASISLLDMILALALSFAIGFFIFFVYKKTYAGVMYSSSFGVTLVALTMVSTFVILAVTSNVRFRTAIKEPLDIAFLFWAIAAGIVLAAGMIPLAMFGSLAIGGVLYFFINRKAYVNPYIVVIRCEDQNAEANAMDFLAEQTERCVVKSKTVQKGSIEINAEIRLKDQNTGFINTLTDMNGVTSAVLVSYNGDYMG